MTAQPVRISQKLRLAIELLVDQAKTQKQAAELAGIHPVSLCNALKKPHVAAFVEQRKQALVDGAAALEGALKAIALHHAHHLMLNAKSEAVQSRVVELLRGEGRSGTQFNVQINNAAERGYEYAMPGQRVVIIEQSPTSQDSPSGQEIDQATDNVDE